MSVRRLAEPAVQPATFAFSKAMQPQVKTWIAKYPKGRQQSAVIPLLMLAQEQEGWVTKAAIEHVADMLEMPDIRVLEVATFYTQFQLKPVGTRAHIQVCGTTPCMLRGAEELMDVCRSKIHHDQFHTNADGTLSWEEVECLGACANAPMVMVFKDTYEDLTPERLAEIIDAFEAGDGDSVKPGPQTDRWYSAPAGGNTSLKNEKDVLKGAKPARVAKVTADAASVPPSSAAKPKTDAIETSPAVKTPSAAKASVSGEKAASVAAPVASARANLASSTVDGTPKQRTGPSRAPSAAAKSGKSWSDLPESEKKATSPVPPAKVEQPLKTAKPEKPSLEDKNRPAGISRPAAVDDLKLISGVGPKLEKLLHELGIFTFAQVASWKKAEREWVDGYLSFHGRIERDDWVKQAKALAKGGVAEYIRVFGKKPV